MVCETCMWCVRRACGVRDAKVVIVVHSRERTLRL